MALKGTLKDFSLADIFQLIGIQRKTGVLTLKNKDDVVTVAFVEGEVVAADSLHRRLEDRLGSVLVKSGRITEVQLQEALRVQKNTLKRMGNILVNLKFIDAATLQEALQVQISQMVYRLFRWRDGEYDFSQEGRVDYDRENVVPMSAESILMEGARILDEWPMIEKGLKSFNTVFRRANVEIATGEVPSQGGQEPEEEAQTVTLNDEERLIYDRVDGNLSVQEIVERSRLSEFDTCRILFELLTRQIIEEVASPAQKKARAARKEVRDSSPVLIGFGFLLLILVTGAVSIYRAEPWLVRMVNQEPLGSLLSPTVGEPQVDRLQLAIGRSRLQRIEFALDVYYLLNRGYPINLESLVMASLLEPADLKDPWGRLYLYEPAGDGYRLLSPGTAGADEDRADRRAASRDSGEPY